jgi:glutamate dehydrogenase
MYDETGATPAMTARAFTVMYKALDIPAWWAAIENLDAKISWQLQSEMMQKLSRIIRRFSRWILRNHRGTINVPEMIDNLAPKLDKLVSLLPKLLSDSDRERHAEIVEHYVSGGVPKMLASRIADTNFMFPLLDIISAAEKHELSLTAVAETYYALNDRLSFSWFRDSTLRFDEEGYWQTLSGAGLRDDSEKLQRLLVVSILNMSTSGSKKRSVSARVEEWIESYRYLVDRWCNVVNDIRSGKQEFVNHYIALRGMLDLAQASLHGGDSYQNREVHLSL